MPDNQKSPDERRYILVGPAGREDVSGSAELADRVAAANQGGECMAWRQVNTRQTGTGGA